MFTPKEAERFASLITLTSWSPLNVALSAELAAFVRRLLAAQGPTIVVVPVSRPLYVRALGHLKKHRDDCHMFRAEHLELSSLVAMLEKEGGIRG